MLRRRGHRVYYIGANTPVDDLVQLSDDVDAAAVLISASMPDALAQLRARADRLDGIAPVLIFGGAAFDREPAAAEELGGRYLTPDVTAAVERLEAMLERQPELAS